jgi:ferredoxin
MAFSITNHCISCNACKLVCPENAIQVEQQFSITAHRCNECETHFDHAQCASICPVENAIIDGNSMSLNPTLSLSPSPEVARLLNERHGAKNKRTHHDSIA